MDELRCEACGKNMMNKTGEVVAGIRYTLQFPETVTEDELEFYGLQWGKYFNANGVDIHLCMECLIDAMFSNRNPYL